MWVRWEKKGTARWTEYVGEMGEERYSRMDRVCG